MGVQGYRLLATWHDNQALALVGYWPQENLVYSRFLYVDDLIMTQDSRGQRLGARLLQHLRIIAHEAGCTPSIFAAAGYDNQDLGIRLQPPQAMLGQAGELRIVPSPEHYRLRRQFNFQHPGQDEKDFLASMKRLLAHDGFG